MCQLFVLYNIIIWTSFYSSSSNDRLCLSSDLVLSWRKIASTQFTEVSLCLFYSFGGVITNSLFSVLNCGLSAGLLAQQCVAACWGKRETTEWFGALPQFSTSPPALEVAVELPNMLKWLSVPAPKEAEGEEWFLPDGFSKGAETLKSCFSSCQVCCLSPVQHFCPQPSCIAFFIVPGWREGNKRKLIKPRVSALAIVLLYYILPFKL